MTRFLILPAFFALGIVAMTGCKSTPANFSGLDAYSDGNITKAMEHFDEAVSLKLGNFFIYRYHRNNRGVTNYVLSSYSDALGDYNIALLIKDNYYHARSNRSTLYLSRGDDERALIDVDRAIEEKENFRDGLFNKTRVLLATGELDRALDLANQVIALIADEGDDPDMEEEEGDWPLGYYLRGMIHQQLGNMAAAQRDFDRAYNQDEEILFAVQEPYLAQLKPGHMGR